MISRLTACAALFAVIGTTSLAVAAGSPGDARRALAKPSVEAQAPVLQLEPVVITVKRQPR